MKEEHEQALVEMMSREKIRDIAEQQVMFNEALNKAMEEKNKQLEVLTASNVRLEEKLSKIKRDSKDQDCVQQLADLGQKNTRLECTMEKNYLFYWKILE